MTAFLAVGGGDSPQSSSIRRSRETNSFACRSRTARTSRSFSLPSGTGSPSSSTSSGPRIRNSTGRFYRFRKPKWKHPRPGLFIRLVPPVLPRRPQSRHGSPTPTHRRRTASPTTARCGRTRAATPPSGCPPRPGRSSRRSSTSCATSSRRAARASPAELEGRPLHDRDRPAAREGRLADRGRGRRPTADNTRRNDNEQALCHDGDARPRSRSRLWPPRAGPPAPPTGATTNGRLAFGININGNTDVYSVQPERAGLAAADHRPGLRRLRRLLGRRHGGSPTARARAAAPSRSGR